MRLSLSGWKHFFCSSLTRPADESLIRAPTGPSCCLLRSRCQLQDVGRVSSFVVDGREDTVALDLALLLPDLVVLSTVSGRRMHETRPESAVT